MNNLLQLSNKLWPADGGGIMCGGGCILLTIAYGALVFSAAFYFTVMLGMMLSRALFGEEATNKASMVLLGFTALFTVARFIQPKD